MSIRPTARITHNVNQELIEAMVNRLQEFQRVNVGIPSGEQDTDGGLPMAELGAILEYGTVNGHIKEFPWLRSTLMTNLPKYIRWNRVNVAKVMRGIMTPQDAMDNLGVMAVGDVVTFIDNNTYTIAASTAKEKGSTRALIDTGNFKQSIKHVIGGTDD
jgi:hypothetical protein